MSERTFSLGLIYIYLDVAADHLHLQNHGLEMIWSYFEISKCSIQKVMKLVRPEISLWTFYDLLLFSSSAASAQKATEQTGQQRSSAPHLALMFPIPQPMNTRSHILQNSAVVQGLVCKEADSKRMSGTCIYYLEHLKIQAVSPKNGAENAVTWKRLEVVKTGPKLTWRIFCFCSQIFETPNRSLDQLVREVRGGLGRVWGKKTSFSSTFVSNCALHAQKKKR